MSDFRIENGELVEYTGKGGDVVIPDSVTSSLLHPIVKLMNVGVIIVSKTVLLLNHRLNSALYRAVMSDFRIENGELVEYTGKGGDVVIPDSVTSIGDRASSVCCSH